jgi:hypothetical protein
MNAPLFFAEGENLFWSFHKKIGNLRKSRMTSLFFFEKIAERRGSFYPISSDTENPWEIV